MYKKRYRQKTFQNCRLFKPLTIVTDLYTYMRSSEEPNIGMTNIMCLIGTVVEAFGFIILDPGSNPPEVGLKKIGKNRKKPIFQPIAKIRPTHHHHQTPPTQ